MSGERVMYEGKYGTLHILDEDALATFGYSNLDGLASWQEKYPRGGNRIFILTEFQGTIKAREEPPPPVNDVAERLKVYGERIGLAEGEILHIKDVADNRNAWLNDRINRLIYQVEENKKADDHERRIAVLEEWVGMLIAHIDQPGGAK